MASNPGAKELASPKLLEKIDKLFELNIGEYVALPQLVVVGDQSSGKSSVLEGLTGLAFPRNMGLCTRFATQITFRRAPVQSTTVSIIPAADADLEHSEKLRAWKADQDEALDTVTFERILNEVHHLMGVGTPDQDGMAIASKTFSDDVLKIEIQGPNEQHLSVIDVPGIFKKITAGVTTRNDMDMVRKMVSSYMENPRSIILAVVPANVDVATQEILDMVEERDPQGQRTLDVLTKPDLVDKGAEQSVVDIVEGKSHSLNLGWCIVKNPGQQELTNSLTDRSIAENSFFKIKDPWTKLPKDRIGTEALRNRLVEILGEMVQREFSKVKTEISQRLKKTKKQLEELGPSRDTREQQFSFLFDLATRFQDVAGHALKAHYGSDDLFDESVSLNLATAVVNRNAMFSDGLWKWGHTRRFEKEASGRNEDVESQHTEESEEDQEVEDYEEIEEDEECPATTMRTRNYKTEHEDINIVLQDNSDVSEPSSNSITKWLEEVYKESRGFELGTFDASLLPIIWKKQSAKWDEIALGYISDIVSLVHSFTVELLLKICHDERLLRELYAVLADSLIERYKKSIDFTKFILSVERAGTPLTTNHYFADNLEKSREQRMRARMAKSAFIAEDGTRCVRLDAKLSNANASNLTSTISDLHDILKAYYKVARKRFVDNVCMQASDHYLVNGPDTPVKVFSPKFVSELTDEQLEAIAGEEVGMRRKRAQLKRDIENLEKGRRVLI